MKEYIVTNYRYGKPKGTIITKDMIDEDRIRFLAPIKKAKMEKE